ncbi:hypothetical protein D9M68_869300 [compost metagenome]
MEVESPHVADTAQRAALVTSHHSLSRIFNDKKSVAGGDVHDDIHLTGNTCIMNGDDSFGFWGNSCFDLVFINIHSVRADIDENDFRPTQDKGIGCTDKGVTGHDDLIARLHIDQ